MSGLRDAIQSVWRYVTSRSASWKFARGCLCVGGAILAGPLWLPFVEAFIENRTGTAVNAPSPVIGVIVIALGLIPVLADRLVEATVGQQEKRRHSAKVHEHDARLAKAVRDGLGQDDFEWFLHVCGDTHTMREKHRRQLGDLEHLLASDETGFLDEDMQAAEDAYEEVIRNLLHFSAMKFFVPDNSQITDEFWMFPAGNWDRGAPTPEQEKTHGRLTRELSKHLADLGQARSNFLQKAREKMLL